MSLDHEINVVKLLYKKIKNHSIEIPWPPEDIPKLLDTFCTILMSGLPRKTKSKVLLQIVIQMIPQVLMTVWLSFRRLSHCPEPHLLVYNASWRHANVLCGAWAWVLFLLFAVVLEAYNQVEYIWIEISRLQLFADYFVRDSVKCLTKVKWQDLNKVFIIIQPPEPIMLTLYKRHRGIAMFLTSKLIHTNHRLKHHQNLLFAD